MTLAQKWRKTKYSKNLSFGGVYFMKKIQNFVFDPLWTHLFGGTLAPQEDLGLKKYMNQKFLELNFMVVSYILCQKSEIQNF